MMNTKVYLIHGQIIHALRNALSS